jgi:hypothetical protein
MADGAEIRSVEAIAEFRTALLLYISKVRPLLDDAADEVQRTQEWLRVSQRAHWENQARARRRELAEARQALFSAELARLRAPTSAETVAVHKARRELDAAEERLARVKKLAAVFDKEARPRLNQTEQLRALVANELPEAARFLERIMRALESYATGGVKAEEAPI